MKNTIQYYAYEQLPYCIKITHSMATIPAVGDCVILNEDSFSFIEPDVDKNHLFDMFFIVTHRYYSTERKSWHIELEPDEIIRLLDGQRWDELIYNAKKKEDSKIL